MVDSKFDEGVNSAPPYRVVALPVRRAGRTPSAEHNVARSDPLGRRRGADTEKPVDLA